MHFDHGVYVWILCGSYYVTDNKYLRNVYVIAQGMPNLKICVILKKNIDYLSRKH